MAKSVRIPRTGSPRRALTQLATAGATGALHIGTEDCIYLANGAVVFAESGSSPSIGDLLTASDRLAPQTWLAALATGGAVGKADVRPPAWLVQQGHLTHGELELCVLGAIYDAAYFALGSASALLRFVDGETHGMGAVTSVDPAVLAREVARRRKLLDEIYHEPGVDHGVVVPVRRPPVPRVVLSALQWEIIGRADGTLNPIGLAKELGRAGYAVLTEVRRLAAAGLIALPAGAIPLVVRNAPVAHRPAPLIPYTEQVERSDVATGLARVDPAVALSKPAVALGSSPAALGNPAAALGNPGAARGSSAGARGIHGADVGDPPPALGNPAAVLNNPSASLGDPGMPRRRTPVAPDRSEARSAAFDEAARPIRAAVPAPAPPGSLPALPRRAPGERLPEMTEELPDVAPPVPADEALLKRIRTALKALR